MVATGARSANAGFAPVKKRGERPMNLRDGLESFRGTARGNARIPGLALHPKRRRAVRNFVTGWAFLLPAFALLAVFQLIPAVLAVALSFTDYHATDSPTFTGLANYARLLEDRYFLTALRNSLIYLLVTPVIIVFSLAAALLVNREIRGIRFFRAAYYLPVVTPVVATAIVWRFLFASPDGLLNGLWMSLPFVKQPLHFLTSSTLALPSVMSVELWKGVGYYMVIFLAGLRAIPSELHDAARVDGASAWQETVRVTIPQLRPSLTFVAVISGMAALKAFDLPFVMTGGGPAHSSETLVMRIYTEAFEYLNIGYAATQGVILLLVTMGLSYINLRLMEGGGVE